MQIDKHKSYFLLYFDCTLTILIKSLESSTVIASWGSSGALNAGTISEVNGLSAENRTQEGRFTHWMCPIVDTVS